MLDRRITVCKALQSLAGSDSTGKSLAAWEDLVPTLKTTKDHWGIFPADLKIKLSFAFLIRGMESIAKVNIADDSDKEELSQKVGDFVDSLMPHLGDTSWNPLQSSYAGLCAQAFLDLSGHVKELSEGRAAEDSNAIETAAATCVQVLQAVGKMALYTIYSILYFTILYFILNFTLLYFAFLYDTILYLLYFLHLY